MATIKEIAELAGVSRGTVDRVLNGRGSVCKETEEKIRRIIQQLDYKPNKAGMALAAQKNKYRVGIILFSKMNPFFDDVMIGFEQMAENLSVYGCTILVKRVAYNPQAQLSAIRACVKEDIKGLIITPYNDEQIANEINVLSRMGIPVITVNSDIEHAHRLAYIGSNYYHSGGAAGALFKLVTTGCVNMGIINGDLNILCHSQRFNGLVDKLSEDSRFRVVCHGENFDDDQQSYNLVSKMLDEHPQLNAFYFAAGGVYGGCRAIAERKKPGEVQVITYDDVSTTIEMLERGYITATICQQPIWQGQRALDLMFSYLSNGILPEREEYFADLTIKIKETI